MCRYRCSRGQLRKAYVLLPPMFDLMILEDYESQKEIDADQNKRED